VNIPTVASMSNHHVVGEEVAAAVHSALHVSLKYLIDAGCGLSRGDWREVEIGTIS
jgi:hypothetical protein